MPDLQPALSVLQLRADQLEHRISARSDYARIVANSLPLHARMERDYESMLAAIRILTDADTGPSCPGDCLLCDVPAAECELPAEPEPPGAA